MTVVRARWFPADVVLPGQQRNPWHRCYALATEDRLYLFRRPSEDADWSSLIDWSKTTLPTTDRLRAARRGIDVHTTAGLVVVTLGSGCRCGSLGRWAGPGWARTETIRA